MEKIELIKNKLHLGKMLKEKISNNIIMKIKINKKSKQNEMRKKPLESLTEDGEFKSKAQKTRILKANKSKNIDGLIKKHNLQDKRIKRYDTKAIKAREWAIARANIVIKKENIIIDKKRKEIAAQKRKDNIETKKGFINWKATFEVVKKFTELNKSKAFYKTEIINKSFDDAEGMKKDMEKIIEGRTEEYRATLEKDSPVPVVVLKRVYNKRFTLLKKGKSPDETLNFQAGVINLDKHIDNSVWDKGRNMCVPDMIQYQFTKAFPSDRMKKKITDEAIQRLSCYEEGDKDIAQMVDDDELEPNENGYKLLHIKNYCININQSLYVLVDGKLYYNFPSNRKDRCCPLIFTLKNNHVYPIFDKNVRLGITCKISSKISNEEYADKKKDDREKLDNVILERDDEDDVIEAIGKLMKKSNKMVFPSSKLKVRNNQVNNFEFDGKNYITNYNPLIEEYYGDEYAGQVEVSIISRMEKYKELPHSYFNPQIQNLLYQKSVKYRTHFGYVNEAAIDWIKDGATQGNIDIKCWDIVKCYRSLLEQPLDDFMTIDFNAVVEELDCYKTCDNNAECGVYPLGLYLIKTDDLTIAHQSNVYTNTMVKCLEDEGIEFEICGFIKGKSQGKKLFSDIIQELKDNIKDTDLVKLVVNIITGLLGKTTSKHMDVHFDTNDEAAFHYLQEQTNALVENKFMYKDLDGICAYGQEITTTLKDNNLPMYLQILDWSNIQLHKMIKVMGGELLARKTDCAITGIKKESKAQKKQYEEINMMADEDKSIIGSYRIEEVLPKMESVMNKNRGMDFKFPTGIKKCDNKAECGGWSSNHHEAIQKKLENNKGLLLIGRAGTGKTYCAKKMIKEKLSCKMAFTNKAALVLGGKTIHKTLSMDKGGKINKKSIGKIKREYDIIVIDEISMINSEMWKRLVELKELTDLPFLLIGDYRQLQPIEKGNKKINYFEHPAVGYLCNYKSVELVVRQRYDKPLWDFLEKKDWYSLPLVKEMKVSMIDDYNICYFNQTRKKVNEVCMEKVKDTKDDFMLIKWEGLKNSKGEIDTAEDKHHQHTYIYEGLPIVIYCGNEEMGICKNQFGKIAHFDDDFVYIEGDDWEQPITISLEDFHKYLQPAYCFSVYKSQGETTKKNLNIFDFEFMIKDDTRIYTAASRATKLTNIRRMSYGYNPPIDYDEDLYAECDEDLYEEEQNNSVNIDMCSCGLKKKNICSCKNPNYKCQELNGEYYCINCSKWKCRCCK